MQHENPQVLDDPGRPTAGEMTRLRRWVSAVLETREPPISLTSGGQSMSEVIGSWERSTSSRRLDDARTQHEILCSDARTGLQVRWQAVEYTDFPAIDWVVHLKNTGAADTPILADIQALDVLFPAPSRLSCHVHHARGGLTQADDFEPLHTPLTFRQGGAQLDLAARTGKSSTLRLPFFNLQLGDEGVIGAIGWSGSWAASFRRQKEGVRVRAGMERTHLRLHPGEEIRTARQLLLFWEGGDRTRSQNLLRRLILAHYTPHPNGRLLVPPFCEGAWGAQTEEDHLAKIRWLERNHIPTECYWIDAGWYGDRPVAEVQDSLSGAWMVQVGSWTPNAEAYPRGFGPIGAAAREAGMGFLLWAEPERVFEGTQLAREHPDWLIGPVPSGGVSGMNYMVNLGIPEARRHVTELISNLVKQGGITCYRQDFNDLRVPELFAMADSPDRIGMTEIRHIEGLYTFWDELLERHPGLTIDNCAGGGQRIDLETISRSVALWRSDLQCWPFDPAAMQTQSQGLAPWVPLSAAVCDTPTQYAMRSALGPAIITHWAAQSSDPGVLGRVDEIRGFMDEALSVREYFYGDYYPLLSFSLAQDAWAAWQYDRPDLEAGIVQAFRRSESPFAEACLRMRALRPGESYEVWDADTGAIIVATGKDLAENGLQVTLSRAPGAALFRYRKL